MTWKMFIGGYWEYVSIYWKHNFITIEFIMKKCPTKVAKQLCAMKKSIFTLRSLWQKKPSIDNVIKTLMLGNYKQEYFLNVLNHSYQQVTSPAVQPCTLVFCLLLFGKSRKKIHPAALGNMSKFIRFSKKYFVIGDLNLRTSARYCHWNEL